MANNENLIPFTGADDPRRGRKPKGSIHLSTRIQRMLDDDEFTTELVAKGGKRIAFKGNPAEAIIKTAILKAMSGDTKWAEWLAKHGFGTKQIHEIQGNPVDILLEKYGLKETEPSEESKPKEEKLEDDRQAPPT